VTAPRSVVHVLATLIASNFAMTTPVHAQDEGSYRQQEDIVYGESGGVGLLMDVFTPTGPPNGLGIVDVISGAWFSDRGKIRDHKRAGVFGTLCQEGYSVFAIRPGSVSKFGAVEMLEHVRRGIRHVKGHAQRYAIDPDRLGLMGASAGGHLACLAAVTAGDDTRVKAVAVFFPPTDLLDYGGHRLDVQSGSQMGGIVRRLVFPDGLANLSDQEVEDRIAQICPARQVTANAPPFLLIHGDADPVVPLQQSETMVAALRKAQVPTELIVKPGGGHPWPTIREEVKVLAQWFNTQLGS